MTQNPMDLFSNKLSQNKQEKAPEPKIVAPFLEKDEKGNLPPFPDNWRQKLDEARHFLTQMRDYGSQVAARYNMTDDEFAKTMEDTSNFSQEERDLLAKTREDIHRFTNEMRDLLKDYEPVKKKIKKKIASKRGWINVD